MMNLKLKDRKGFTLIELLIVVAIIGIIAAIAIPNLLNAIQRGKQKRTVADVRTIGSVLETFNIDYNYYPQHSGVVGDCQGDLVPNYIQKLPIVDAWNEPIEYTAADPWQAYTVASCGKDVTPGDRTGGSTQLFDDDIVFLNGSFFQWPDGPQS